MGTAQKFMFNQVSQATELIPYTLSNPYLLEEAVNISLSLASSSAQRGSG